MNWKNEIEEIFKLATLHSWCTQVDQLIEKFNVANPEAKHITLYLQSQKDMVGRFLLNLSMIIKAIK